MQEPQLDSLKLRLPKNWVKIKDDRLTDKIITVFCNETTGHIIDDSDVTYHERFRKTALYKKENGITVRFAIEKQNTALNIVKEFIVISVNSKQLEKPYLEGITFFNNKLVYEYIIRLGVIDVPYTTFLKGECTDCDFKVDIELDGLINYIDMFEKMTRPSKYGYKPFKRKNNVGFEWSSRDTNAFKTFPFLKIYDKGKQLKSESFEFANTYLDPKSYERLVRIETTVKNKSHFKALGVTDTSLKSLLGLSREFKEKVLLEALNCHLIRVDEKDMEKSKSLSSMERGAYNHLLSNFKQGMDFHEAKQWFTLGYVGNSLRRRDRLATDVYLNHLSGSTLDKKVTTLENFFQRLGLK